MDAPKEPLYITVQKDRTVYLMETQIPLEELAAKLGALAKNGNEEQLFVRADASTDYGAVMEVMGVLNSAGYKKIGLVTLQKEQPVAP